MHARQSHRAECCGGEKLYFTNYQIKYFDRVNTMRRTGHFLAIAASIFLFDGCSGSEHGKSQDEVPVVQDLEIKSDTPSSESATSESSSEQ